MLVVIIAAVVECLSDVLLSAVLLGVRCRRDSRVKPGSRFGRWH